MDTETTCGGYEEQLRESRAENLRHHKHVEHLADRLQAEQEVRAKVNLLLHYLEGNWLAVTCIRQDLVAQNDVWF